MFKIEARMEDIIHAGKVETPFAGVDFYFATRQADRCYFARSQEDGISR